MQWTSEDTALRVAYTAALRRGEVICTRGGELQTKEYMRFCRNVFQEYYDTLKAKYGQLTYQEVADFLNRG